MIVERDIAVKMDDGVSLRADVYRPDSVARFPVILTMGPYGKNLLYKDGYPSQWKWLVERHPEILDGSTCSQMTWETVDPERWVPRGYAVVRIDSRGAGRSPGVLDLFSPRETQDYYDCIEWAAKQPWSTGKVGLCGISYYAINQWMVAALNPPHLTAMIAWEGAADFYRDFCYHGGILCNVFMEVWYQAQVLSIQHGLGRNGPKTPWVDGLAAGPDTYSLTDLIANRVDWISNIKKHGLYDEFHRSRSADFSKVKVPFLSAANWGGFGLHPRGNFEGFTRAASRNKWLEVHGGRHEENFYLPASVELQMKFFDFYLKGERNSWDKEARVNLIIRHIDHFESRKENEWPLARTKLTKLHLDAKSQSLSWASVKNPGRAKFDALGDGLVFYTMPLEESIEITGPLSARLYISSSTTDADIFVTLLAFSENGKEVEFQGTLDPHTPLAQGCLRASHRELDKSRSKISRPYHSHKRIKPLRPNSVYPLDVEIWPTCIILPEKYRLALMIQGKDFQRKEVGNEETFRGIPMRGSGPFLHNNPDDRPRESFAGKTTIYTGTRRSSFVVLPIIPRS